MSNLNLLNFLNKILTKTYEDLSAETIERTKWIVLDCIAACWDGMQSSELRSLAAQVGKKDPDEIHYLSLIGSPLYTSGYNQLLLHGTAIVSNEVDEGSQFAKGHPAAHIFPPAYQAAIEQKADGKEFIRAIVLAYEISARFAYAANMKDEMHPHGTWGVIGGAVAAGLLQKKSVEEMVDIVLLAASLPMATSWEAAVKGQTVRHLYTGISAQIAYQVLDLQKSGFESNMAVVNHLWGTLLSDGMDERIFEKDVWEPPLIEKNFMKYYPSCRFSHSSIDALLLLKEKYKMDPDDIQEIVVHTYELAARLADQAPVNKLSAKFSIPFLLSFILEGHDLFDSFEEPFTVDEKILALARKVKVLEDTDMTAALPDERAARVTIQLKNEQKVSAEVRDASGSFKEGLSKEKLTNKYRRILKEDAFADRMIEFVLTMDKAERLDQWIQLLPQKSEVGV